MTMFSVTRPPNSKGLWLHWCDVDGYSAADCPCSVGWFWFESWAVAEVADRQRRARGSAPAAKK